jgi:hypothetical protein
MKLRVHTNNKVYYTGKQVNDYLISKVQGQEDILVSRVSEYLRANKERINEITLESTCNYLKDFGIDLNINALTTLLQSKEKIFSRMKYEALNAFDNPSPEEFIEKPKLLKNKNKKRKVLLEKKDFVVHNPINNDVVLPKNQVSISQDTKSLAIQVNNNIVPKKIINLNIEGLQIRITIG